MSVLPSADPIPAPTPESAGFGLSWTIAWSILILQNLAEPKAIHVPLSLAKARLTDLVRQAEAGEEVVLTRHGRPAARIVPVPAFIDGAKRAQLIERVRASAARTLRPGPEAARSQDFLYGDDGLPQ